MRPRVGFIDAPWWEVLGAELRAETMTRETWISEVAHRLGLVIREDDADAATSGQD